MPENMLKPRKVGIAYGRHAIRPSRILAEALATPVRNVKRRVGEDMVEAKVFQFILVKTPLVVPADVCIDTAYCQIHLRQTPGRVVALLSIDRDVADTAAV